MDPNTIKPSPPSSIYARSSTDSLRSSTTTSAKRRPWGIPPTTKTATMLPFALQLHIFKHASDTLERLLFATTLCTSDGRRLAWLAGEMDAVRLGMVAADALTDKHLPLTTKHALEARLLAALNQATRQHGHHYYHHHQPQRPLSEEVERYSQEDKMRENPWTDMGCCGQNRWRNYLLSSAASASVSPTPSLAPSLPSSAASGKYIPPAKRGTGSWRRRDSRCGPA
ncbi:MAG: hypothetical protein Q9203_002763 [Teloschistes exilis]